MSIKQKLADITERKIKKLQNRRRDWFRKHKKDITFTIWWWIAKNIEDKYKLDHVCSKMSGFYTSKNNRFENLGVSDVVVLNDTVFIYLIRPGLIIGKGGENIDSLTEYINADIDGTKAYNYRIDLIEDRRSWLNMYYYSFATRQWW